MIFLLCALDSSNEIFAAQGILSSTLADVSGLSRIFKPVLATTNRTVSCAVMTIEHDNAARRNKFFISNKLIDDEFIAKPAARYE